MFMGFLLLVFRMAHSSTHPTMSRPQPRIDASRSSSPPSHGPTPYNPPLTMGSIESTEFFTRWRPVLVMVKFHDLSRLEEA